MITLPPFLKPGDTIAITCPAGYMAAEKASKCIEILRNWKYNVVVGSTLGSSSLNYFSGSDEERLSELQAMLDDKRISAILFGRGGYGTGRIIDKIDFKTFRKHPKWLIGFSDITLLHNHLLSKYKIASIHGPMAALFNDDNATDSTGSLRTLIAGKKSSYTIDPNANNVFGKATGTLVGGNLALLCNIIGTASDFKTEGRILFIEDIGEYIYSLDRMFSQLHRSGKLKDLAALILGGFTDMKDTERPFGRNVEEVLQEWAAIAKCPVVFNFPVSHSSRNFALIQGGKYRLNISAAGTTLKLLKH
ncbi:MAG: LD-carboxypeptidase [Chitinophagaceae bacterium]|nr:MAG: LD-carboxypeptidase [Chitinophagaceae bacterium]